MKDKLLLNYYEINNIKYIVMNELDYNDKHYVYLSNMNDEDDIMVRIVKSDKLEPLETEEELVEVLKMLIK